MRFASLLSIGVLIGNVLTGSGAVAALERPQPPVPGIRIEVSLSDRQLRVLRGDELMRSYPVAVGQERYPTPTGDFRVARVIWNPRWVPPEAEWAKDETTKEPGDPDNPMGKVKIFFEDPDYYIHGTDEEESLGQPASHGCLRMTNADVVELARLVMEHGGENRPPNWFQRIINFVRSTEEVRLSDPIPLHITA